MSQTIRELIKDRQNEIRKGNISPIRATELVVELSALWGNVNEALLEREIDYNKKLNQILNEGDTVASSKVKAQITKEYKNYLEAKNLSKLITEMIRGLKFYIRQSEKEENEAKYH